MPISNIHLNNMTVFPMKDFTCKLLVSKTPISEWDTNSKKNLVAREVATLYLILSNKFSLDTGLCPLNCILNSLMNIELIKVHFVWVAALWAYVQFFVVFIYFPFSACRFCSDIFSFIIDIGNSYLPSFCIGQSGQKFVNFIDLGKKKKKTC